MTLAMERSGNMRMWLMMMVLAWCWCCCCHTATVLAQPTVTVAPTPAPAPIPIPVQVTLAKFMQDKNILRGECNAEREENGPCLDDPDGDLKTMRSDESGLMARLINNPIPTCASVIALGGTCNMELAILKAYQASDSKKTFIPFGITLRDYCPKSCGVCRDYAIAGQVLHDCTVDPMSARRRPRLAFDNMRIRGFIPTLIWGGFKVLEQVILRKNELTGTIPTEIGLATVLYDLQLFENKLDG
jgi:hypothetical protein